MFVVALLMGPDMDRQGSDMDKAHCRKQFEIAVVVVQCRGRYWAHCLVLWEAPH